MRDFLNLLVWIVIIGLLVGGIQISTDPEKMEAPFKIGDDVTMKITSDDSIDGAVTSYFLIKVRWSDEEKWRSETYTIQYKDDNGEIETHKCKSELLSKMEEKLDLYDPDTGSTDDYVKSLIEGTSD